MEDSGPGVPESLRVWIFVPLNTTTQEDGVGLGLTIVRDVVESYSGKVSVDTSDTLGGAQFIAKIPLIEVEDE